MSIKPDIIVFVETNLNKNISDSELCLQDYSIFRRDRYKDKLLKGGGILVAIGNNLNPRNIYCNYEFECEQLFVKIILGTRELIIGAVYIPPSSASEVYSYHTHVVENVCLLNPKSDIILLGDYNLPHTVWVNNDDIDGSLSARCSHKDKLIHENVDLCLTTFCYLNLYQRFNLHVDKGYSLDLCFTSLEFHELDSFNYSESLIHLDRHHDFCSFKIKLKKYDSMNASADGNQFVRNFYKTNFEALNCDLKNIEWLYSDDSSLEGDIENFYTELNKIIDKHVPCVNIKNKLTFPKWFSFDLIKNIIIKKKRHKIWIQTELDEDRILFKKSRALCMRLYRIDQKKYLDDIQKKTSKNIKEFWRHINSISKTNGIPKFVSYKGYTSASITDSCNLFATYFKSTYPDPLEEDLNCLDILCNSNALDNDLFDFSISDNEIKLALNKLGDGVTTGSDGMSEIFVKKCGGLLFAPLKFLYNKSIKTGVFPKVWKESFVTPVFKSGVVSEVENYRPITILGSFAKIFDSIIATKFNDYFISTIINEQHGFVKNKSTLSNLLFFCDYITDSLNSSYQVDCLYLDFQKAFDSVNHVILIEKLINLGLRGSILRWLCAYLTERSLTVRIKGNCSNSFLVRSGVPQGSHLGPLLFILFINDINSNLKFSKVLLFADDVKMFHTIKSPLDQSKLQIDLDSVVEWTKLNKLVLNIDKCSIMNFSRGHCFDTNYLVNGYCLKKVTVQKDLGILFQNNFEFDNHINYVINNAYKVLGFLHRSSKQFKTDSIIYMYKVLVRSVLLYNSQIWSPHQEILITKLEAIQHKFLRHLSYRIGKPLSYDDHCYTEIAKTFNLCTIKSLHDYYDLLLMKKIMFHNSNGLFTSSLADLFLLNSNSLNLRNKRELKEFHTNKNYIFHSAIFRLRRSWNKLSDNMRHKMKISIYKKSVYDMVSKFA